MIPKPMHICHFRIYERKNKGTAGQPTRIQIRDLSIYSYIHIFTLYRLITAPCYQLRYLYFDLMLPTRSICVPSYWQSNIPLNIPEFLTFPSEDKRLSHIKSHKPTGFADEKEPT